jgi:hypothetical protein
MVEMRVTLEPLQKALQRLLADCSRETSVYGVYLRSLNRSVVAAAKAAAELAAAAEAAKAQEVAAAAGSAAVGGGAAGGGAGGVKSEGGGAAKPQAAPAAATVTAGAGSGGGGGGVKSELPSVAPRPPNATPLTTMRLLKKVSGRRRSAGRQPTTLSRAHHRERACVLTP